MTRTCSKRWLPILKQLAEGLLVITASNRQADFLRQQFRYFQVQQHKTVWLRPAIITDKQWLSALFQQLMTDYGEQQQPWTLLSNQESRLLWEQIIENDDDYLLDTRRTAERVRQAANRIEQWLLNKAVTDDDSFNWREETRRFKHWQQLVKQKCQTNLWLEQYQLDGWLASRLPLLINNNGSKLLPQEIGLLGFQQISPARAQLFNTLEAAGITLTNLSVEAVNPEVYRIELPDNREEIKQAAVWAKNQWLEDPEQRIGIVLPGLNHHRELVRLTFERIFCAAEILKIDDQTGRPYDISLGSPLSSYPLIDSALMLLTLLSEPIAQDEILQLLLSPYILATEQQPHTIALTRLLRESRQPHFTIKDLLFFSSQIDNEDASVKETLQSLTDFPTAGKLPPSQWALKLADLLSQIHWCEKRPLSSTEFQTKEAWNKKIEQMAVYDHLSGNIGWSRFRSLFTRAIRETLFQAQTGDCPVQVMGVLEAAFLTFDKIRICSIDNRLWPESARPSPFIPYELQRLHDMPNATAERELRVSKQLLQLLSNAADQVIFSHCQGKGEESLSVSPLLEDVELRPHQADENYLSPAEQINQPGKNLEYIADDRAPEISASTIRGGSKLLQDIARCQFRAFAHHRLYANAAEQPREGLDPLDRGNLVHQILEQCWLHLFDKQQSRLQTLHQTKQLETAIEPFIEKALGRLQKQRHKPLTEAIINLEQQRLKKLLLQWFEMELRRPGFTVKEVEQSVDAPVAGNFIRVQLDRVDELEDGSMAIIDYKTGQVARKNWFGERPDEPQLPLYSMVLSEQGQTIGALLYGQVKNAECRFVGIADNHRLVSGVTRDYNRDPLNTDSGTLAEQVIKWRKDLHKLLQEYLAGESAVTPRDEFVCQYCDLHGLCRIGEMKQRSLEQVSLEQRS